MSQWVIIYTRYSCRTPEFCKFDMSLHMWDREQEDWRMILSRALEPFHQAQIFCNLCLCGRRGGLCLGRYGPWTWSMDLVSNHSSSQKIEVSFIWHYGFFKTLLCSPVKQFVICNSSILTVHLQTHARCCNRNASMHVSPLPAGLVKRSTCQQQHHHHLLQPCLQTNPMITTQLGQIRYS